MTRRASIFALCVAWLLSCPMAASAQDAGDKAPDIGSLARAGRSTLARLEKQAATWTTTTQLTGGARVLVEVLVAPGMRRTILSTEAQGR